MQFTIALLSALAALATAAPTAAGPSGTLTQPTGGTHIDSIGGSGFLSVSYTQVTESNSLTVAIDLLLKPINGNTNPAVTLATGLGPKSQSDRDPITANFATESACGDYRLVVTEYQIHNNSPIRFQSAAPTINIACYPIQ